MSYTRFKPFLRGFGWNSITCLCHSHWLGVPHPGKAIIEKERECDTLYFSNWMKLPRDWIGWILEIDCNQSNNGNSTKQNKRQFRQRQSLIFLFSFSKWRGCGFLYFREYPDILRMTFSRAGASKTWKWKWKWKSTCCLQIGSEVKWIFSIMNVAFSEIWNV